MANGVVLVVEDNDTSLKLACELLRMHGYEALPAGTGADALRLARERVPDLVLLDVQLPDMAGDEVLASLRTDDRLSAIPVVAVTAYAMKGDRERLLLQGVDHYISKLIDITTFVADIARLVGDRQIALPNSIRPPSRGP